METMTQFVAHNVCQKITDSVLTAPASTIQNITESTYYVWQKQIITKPYIALCIAKKKKKNVFSRMFCKRESLTTMKLQFVRKRKQAQQ